MDRGFLKTLLILNLVIAVVADWSSVCSKSCKCNWVSGNKQATCSNSSLTQIPSTLSHEIQVLDLSNNVLNNISKNAFKDVNLNNLKKLIMKHCSLQVLHKYSFNGLAIIIEIDLSNNLLKTLHADTFLNTSKIRTILLNENRIEKLDDGLFSNLEFLQKVDLSNNRIAQLGTRTFSNLPKFSYLKLNGNRIEHLKVEHLNNLTNLGHLEIQDNPWRCDCHLERFKDYVTIKKWDTSSILCAEPSVAQGKPWKDLKPNDFVCQPNIIYPTSPSTVRSNPGQNVTIACQVSGNPLREVSWVLNGININYKYRYQGETKYILSNSSLDNGLWINLTIVDADSKDNGKYFCSAKNMVGIAEQTVVVSIAGEEVIVPSGMDNNMMPVLIGVSCTAAILLIIVVILCYCCCKRRNSEKKKADNSNGEALIEGSVIPEMEKSLISAVNPVTKPPRRYDAPPSITSGATEMSELNKTLLDNDSVFAHNDDEKRSLDFEHQKRSHDALNVEYGRTDGRAYPPDLLSFPARAAQISPAASNASTVPDTTRLPPQHNPISPIHSPIYGITTNQNLFRTLPYSRSQSPFISPVTPPVVTPRQGYVTIPRRPRIPSWSSTASTQILPSSEAQEPLYDNLGLRTTLNGSSVLSLNRTGLEQQQFSPMKNRPLPATPTNYPTPHQVFYAPIEEQEPAPSPFPQYNSRNSIISQMSTQLSTPGPQEPVNPRMSWTAKNTSTPQPEPRKMLFSEKSADAQSQASDNSTLSRKWKPETGSLRRNPRPENKDEPTSPSKVNDSNVSLNQTGTLGRSGKIPPRPPPKPKKKPNPETSANAEPLFEDEGEDGTEV